MTNQTLSDLRQLSKILTGMLDRCNNHNSSMFKWYGAKGVTVCKRWINHRMMFYSWALSHGWKPGLQIDRIDGAKGYFPSNVRFVTRMTNLGNRGHGDKSTGFNGRRYNLPMNVTFSKQPKDKASPYRVIIAREGVRRSVGMFKTVEEAVQARDEAIIKLEKEVYGRKR